MLDKTVPSLADTVSGIVDGARVVDRIYTDLAIIDVSGDGRLVVRAMVEGMTLAELQAMTAAPLTGMDACAKIAA
jgi:3-oxoadipate CoA-transferase beta subunit